MTVRARRAVRCWLLLKCRHLLVLAAVMGTATVGLAAGCSRAKPESATPASGNTGEPWFEEVAARAGVQFTYQSGEHGDYHLPAITGGGAALFDMDNDGYLDLYLVQAGNLIAPGSGPGNRLFRNRGDGTFEDVTEGSGAGVRAYGMGVTAGDYDNDGNVDLFVTNVGRNVLLRNEGHGHFTDVTRAAGLESSGWSTSAAFVDYDGDGYLDLFVANYINWSPNTELICYTPSGTRDYCSPLAYHAPLAAALYHNNGNGTFTDVSEQAGLHTAFGNGLGVTLGHFDDQGLIDIYVANDRMPNQLWMNLGRGCFRDEALARGCAVDQDGKAKAGMGVQAVDVDGDGRCDLLVVNMEGESDSFYRNEGTYFSDDTVAAGLRTLSRAFTRFGAGLVDFDNDGLLDLYEANGRVSRGDGHGTSDPYAEPNLLLRGTSAGRFAEVLPRGGTRSPLVATSRAAAFGDIDNDGGVDIVVVNRDGPAYILRNIVPHRGHWIAFRVLEEHGRDAIGATVTLKVGGRTIMRDVQVAYGFLAANDPRVHVGLGSAMRVSDVSVRWPDGRVQTFGAYASDQIVTLRRK
jgi:enediyne biosynthesis protein E4